MTSPDSKEVLDEMNCGQRCLLRGLIKAASSSKLKQDVYETTEMKAGGVYSKAKDLRASLGKLFNQPRSSRAEDSLGGSESVEDFLPSFPSTQQRKRSRKGKIPAKGPVKRKVKKFRLKVVGLPAGTSHTPVGFKCTNLTRSVWIRESASAEEVAGKIREALEWKPIWKVRFMYANGRYMRPATLTDVENGSSWDLETVRALMGGGCLYVSRVVPTFSLDDANDNKKTRDNEGDTDIESEMETKDDRDDTDEETKEVYGAEVCCIVQP